MVYDINKIRLENEIYQIEQMLKNCDTKNCFDGTSNENGLKKYLDFLKEQLKEYEK